MQHALERERPCFLTCLLEPRTQSTSREPPANLIGNMKLRLRPGVIPLCTLLAVFALVVSQANAQVKCYRTTTCGGSDFFMSATVEDCCLSDDGVLVELNPEGGEGCETCVVFGWITGNPDPNNRLKRAVRFPETGERRQLVVGFSKGTPDIDAYSIHLSGSITDGSQRQPAFLEESRHYRIEDISNIFISYARGDGMEVGGPTARVPVVIPIDDVALETDKHFTLSFEVFSQSPDNLLARPAVVIVNELQVFIVDQTDLTVQFTAMDYSQDEDGGSLPVAVSLTAAIATDLELRITTRNLTQVYGQFTAGSTGQSPLMPLPDGFPVLAPFAPDEPYIASSVDGHVARVDYNTSTQIITVPAGPARTIQVPIGIVDDEIDEANEYFVLFLETDNPRVDLSRGRFASRGTITDNEMTTIGFEFSEYSFTEDRIPPIVIDVIYIIKEDNRPSELTFTIKIQTILGNATILDDFFIFPQLIEEISPDDDKVDVGFQLIGDDIPEGDETFQLEIVNAGSVPFNISRATTTVTILDEEVIPNDDSKLSVHLQ